MKKLPDKIKIFNRTFKIEMVDEKFTNEFGVLTTGTGIIKINSLQCAESQHQTLFHEIAHAIIFSMGKMKLGEDEEFIELLGNQLHSLIMENDFNFMSEGI